MTMMPMLCRSTLATSNTLVEKVFRSLENTVRIKVTLVMTIPMIMEMVMTME